jgi:hypothetical protein
LQADAGTRLTGVAWRARVARSEIVVVARVGLAFGVLVALVRSRAIVDVDVHHIAAGEHHEQQRQNLPRPHGGQSYTNPARVAPQSLERLGAVFDVRDPGMLLGDVGLELADLVPRPRSFSLANFWRRRPVFMSGARFDCDSSHAA